MRSTFTFGSLHSEDFGLWIFRPATIQTPSRPYEFTSVPGRMGDVPVGGMKLSNEAISYECFFVEDENGYGHYTTYEEALSAFRNAILAISGYQKLSDSFDSEHYREACFAGPISIVSRKDYQMGKFALQFNAKPQRYVYLNTISVAAGATKVLSLTEFPANILNLEPIITVTGTGSITFTDGTNTLHTITITQNPGTIVIDSHLKECYSGANSANGFVQFSNYQFPVFGPFYGYAGQVTVITSVVSIVIDPGGYEI